MLKGRREREAKRWLIRTALDQVLKKVKKAFRLHYLFRLPHQPKEANRIPKRVSVRNKKVHLLRIPTVVLEDQCTVVHCSKDSQIFLAVNVSTYAL